MPGTRKLGRPTAHRKAMLRGLVTYLLEKGQVETTYTRAKEVSALCEKMITLGKTNTLASRRAALAFITKEAVVAKLFSTIAPAYADRNGGYTAVYKIGPRRGDAAEMAIIKLIGIEEPKEEDKKAKKSKKTEEPAVEAPATEEAVVEEAPVEETATEEAPVEETPVEEAPAE